MTGIARRRLARCLAAAMAVLFIAQTAVAADSVVVGFKAGTTRLGVLALKAKIFINRNYELTKLPDELKGLHYGRRSGFIASTGTIDAPAGATVYIMFSTDDPLRPSLASSWTKLSEQAEYLGKSKPIPLTIYKKTFTKRELCELKVTANSTCFVVSSDLRLHPSTTTEPAGGGADTPDDTDPKPVPPPQPQPKSQQDDVAIAGPTTRPVAQQASIHALEIYETKAGLMLGNASEITLTLTPAEKPKPVSLEFVTHAGNQMELARDEAMRFIRVKYPNWFVSKSELSFEDKYTDHDGGSIGTALGTLVLSTIEGFSIDHDVAITGDISANGKVRAIGGLSAKLKGAIASKCTVVAAPEDNYDQLVDGVVYNGTSLVTDVQVIGTATLADAVATVRSDRQPELADAIEKYSALQQTLHAKPLSLKSKETQSALEEITRLAPQHYSAKILMLASTGKLPKTLSVTASLYYVGVATQSMLDEIKKRGEPQKSSMVASSTVKAGLADLRKLRPIASESVRPLIDDWQNFIQALTAYQENRGSAQAVDRQRQILQDEAAKMQADADMMQKMIKEGF